MTDTIASALRDAVLAGIFFGEAARPHAAALEVFLNAGDDALGLWYGTAQAAALAADAALLRARLDRDIVAIDRLIARQLDEILHAPPLRRLEGSWRGLDWLARKMTGNVMTQLRILPISWREIARDLQRAPEFDQSQMFAKIYEQEFGMPGGEPFGLIIVDHEVRHQPGAGAPTDDVEVLAALSSVAAAAFAPMVVAAAPALLDSEAWRDLAMSPDPADCLRDAHHAPWRSLSTRDDMRFIAVALPRLLARRPWRDDPARRDGFRYRESAAGADQRVWTSPVYALAAAALRAFTTYGWPADICGLSQDQETSGVIAGLAHEESSAEPPGTWVFPPLEIVFTPQQEHSLAHAGLIPLCGLPYSREILFSAMPSLFIPPRMTGPGSEGAAANQKLNSQFNVILCASRFVHAVKMQGRDMCGSYKTAPEIERRLQEWLNQYVNSLPGASAEARARKPLMGASVKVNSHLHQPGAFACEIHIAPHYQLESLSANIRLTTNFVAAASAPA